MPTDVIMPQMGESIFEGTLTKWLKKPGDKVSRDEPLFEISTGGNIDDANFKFRRVIEHPLQTFLDLRFADSAAELFLR